MCIAGLLLLCMWIFYINVPLPLIAFILAAIFLRVNIPLIPYVHLDYVGSLTAAAFVICLNLPLIWGGSTYDCFVAHKRFLPDFCSSQFSPFFVSFNRSDHIEYSLFIVSGVILVFFVWWEFPSFQCPFTQISELFCNRCYQFFPGFDSFLATISFLFSFFFCLVGLCDGCREWRC